MARRGPKGTPPELKVIAGTIQPCRARERTVPQLDGGVVKPKWLKGRASKIWDEKVAIYRYRGQNIVGCESALAQYVSLEADLIDQYSKRLTPAMAQVNAYRIFANEFFDTPASQISKAGGEKKSQNPFASNGQRPKS